MWNQLCTKVLGTEGRDIGIAEWDQEDLTSGLCDSSSFSSRALFSEKSRKDRIWS